jgi:hypothetical protein
MGYRVTTRAVIARLISKISLLATNITIFATLVLSRISLLIAGLALNHIFTHYSPPPSTISP